MLEFKNLTKEKDLIYYEGPLLSVFVDKNSESSGVKYFCFWWGFNGNNSLWLLFPVFNEELSCYLNKKVSLRDLILGNAQVQITELELTPTYEVKEVNSYMLDVQNIPESLLPDPDAFHEEDLCY